LTYDITAIACASATTADRLFGRRKNFTGWHAQYEVVKTLLPKLHWRSPTKW
jgi:hypothetical protein